MKKYLLLISVLIVSNIVTGFFLHKSKMQNLSVEQFQSQFPLIDVSRNIIPQEDFIVNLQPLREKLKSLATDAGEEKVSYYIEFLNTGANISFNPDARHYPASLIKMPVAMAVAKKIESGEWQWDSQLVLFGQDVDSRSGKLAGKPIGSRFTIEELLEEMLVASDNTAYNILLRNIGADGVNNYLADTGMDTLFDKELKITAKEYTRIFRSLYSSSYLQRANTQKILEILDKTSDDIYLSKGVPSDVIFSHKFAENVDGFVYADSGIVYIPNRPYIITVMYQGTGEESEDEINMFFEMISKETYEHFKN